jgi:hypothetical protein
MVELKNDHAPGRVQMDLVTRDGSTGIFLVAAFACLIALLANCCAGQVNRGAHGNSANADLSSLVLSLGTLSPSFSPAVTVYSVSVADSVSSVTVTPTAADAGASITVQGLGVVSGLPSGSITLVLGDNSITVVVTAVNGTTTKTYTTIVTRGILYGWELTPENTGLASVGVDKYSLPLYSGPATPAANTTISLMKITSQLDLSNGGITIDRCWISPDPANVGQGVSMLTNWTGAPSTIQDCDFDCNDMTDTQAHMAVVANSFLFLGNGNVLRCHITNAGQGIRVDGLAGTSLVIENNLVHNMWTANSSHVDAITVRKFLGNSLLIQNNWADNSSIPASPAVFIQESDGVIDNTIIEGNYISSSNWGLGLEDGTIRFGRTYGNNMQMINNRFGPTGYGAYAVDGGVGFAQISGNYLYDASNPPDYEGAPVN